MSAVSLLDDTETDTDCRDITIELKLEELPEPALNWLPTNGTRVDSELPELREQDESARLLRAEDESYGVSGQPPALEADATVELLNLQALDLESPNESAQLPSCTTTAASSLDWADSFGVSLPHAWSDKLLAAAARASSAGRALLDTPAAPSTPSAESASASALLLASACRIAGRNG